VASSTTSQEPDKLGVAAPAERAAHREFLRTLIARASAKQRFLISIAGIPGSGKSTLAAFWADIARVDLGHEIQVLPMDGFHYSNDWLGTHFIEKDGWRRSLREMKGSPESFDLLGLWCALKSLREGEIVFWPTYDRRIHEPVPAARPLPTQGIFVVEGNYLLLDEPVWRDLAALFDLRIFVEADPEVALAAVVARHVQGGRTAAEAQAHMERCDHPNAKRILSHLLPAHVRIHRNPDWTFSFVTRELATGK